jgi:endonuclease-8
MGAGTCIVPANGGGNQRVASGIGNVFKSEILFLASIDPFTIAADLADTDLERILSTARELMAANIQDRPRIFGAGAGRRTTGSLNPHARLWVYGRGGQPCRKCGAPIQAKKTGLDARLTYWCARCQK